VTIDDAPQPALLLEEGERLCRVVAPTGQEISVGRVRLLFVGDESDGLDAGALAQRVLKESRDLPMHDLWALLVDEEGEVDPGEACDLLTGTRRGVTRLAFEHRLITDPVHFERRGEKLRPRKRKAVEQELLRRDRMAQIEEELESAVGFVLERLGPLPRPEPDPPSGCTPEEAPLPPPVEELRRLAIAGEESAPSRDAKRLLDRTGFGTGSPWATPHRAAFELLRRLGVFREDEDLLLLRQNVPTRFPDWMMDLARGLSAPADPRRRDRTDLEAYTVDDRTTRDYDDAFALEPEGDGWLLHVLIADPASVLDPGNPLWEESRRRGTTIYHPEGKIPMLPVALSEGQLSLVAGQVRPAMDFVLHLDAHLDPWGMTLEQVLTRVRQNLSYPEVDSMLSGAVDGPPELLELLRRVRAFSLRVQAGRIQRGAMVLRRPEVSVRVNREGLIELSRIDNSSPAREMVAEVMIATGAHAASYLSDKGIPAVYRKQARVADPSIPAFSGVVDDIAGWYAAVRQVRKAELSIHPGAHEGLGLDQYVQVTSPLRRFQDLILHEQLRSFLATGAPRFNQEAMLQSFAEIEELSARNQRIQNESRRYWILKYLVVNQVHEVDATLVWKDRQSWKVVLNDFGVEGTAVVRADATPGSSVRLRVDRVDPRDGVLRLAQ
jgi:exoribonuclease-2